MPHLADTDTSYDVIIVLGAAVWPGGQPSPALRHRVAHAVSAFHAGKGRRLLMTGGLGKHPPPEAHLMRQLALDAGVPAACIVLEEEAISTWQSSVYCTRLLHEHGWSTVLVVTDRYHLPRAVRLFRSLGVCATGSAPPAGPYSRRLWKRWYYRGREGLASVWYLLCIVARSVRRQMGRMRSV